MNQPTTMRQAYLANLIQFFIRETEASRKKYTALMSTARFPVDKKIRLRNLINGADPDNVQSWMDVFAELLGDESIAENSLSPMSIGTVIAVSVAKSSNSLPINVPLAVNAPSATSAQVVTAGGVRWSIYDYDIVRYATDDEIRWFVMNMAVVLLNEIKSGFALSAANKFAEDQVVEVAPPIPEDE